MKAFRFANKIVPPEHGFHCYNISVGISEHLLKNRHRAILLTMRRRSLSSTAAIDNQTSKKTMTMRDKTADGIQIHTTDTTAAATTTTTTTNLSYNSCPLSIVKSSFINPIPVNYYRSNFVLQKLIKQRVFERETYMKTNSIATHELSSLSSSISSYATSLSDIVRMGASFRIPTQQELDVEFPIRPMNWEQIQGYPATMKPTNKTESNKKMQVTWLGHSSLLIQYPNGINVLTDPIFSKYCSPFPNWWGPQRYRPTPCTLSELLQHITIDFVLISHNHYDHLDYPTIQQLYQENPNTTQFVVPLGLQHWLQSYINPNILTYELDWYEHMVYATAKKSNEALHPPLSTSNNEATLQIRSIPMKHWSSRYGYDRDRTLWCGYSLEYIPSSLPSATVDDQCKTEQAINPPTCDSSLGSKFLFSGDTAYYDRMEECVLAPNNEYVNQPLPTTLTKKHGNYHYDVAAIPIGAYEPRQFMYHNHMNVAEAIQMKDDLSCQHAIPIHWGTFPLTIESVMEPRNKLQQLMKHRDDSNTFIPWQIGETKQY